MPTATPSPSPAPVAPVPAPAPLKDALLAVQMRLTGPDIQPFSLQKQTAVRTGVANAVGVQPSDVTLEIQRVFGSQSTAGRRLLQLPFPGQQQPQQQQPGFPGAGQMPQPGQQGPQNVAGANPMASQQSSSPSPSQQSRSPSPSQQSASPSPSQQSASPSPTQQRSSPSPSGAQSPAPSSDSSPGVEVQLLIRTASGTAQQQMDHLQRTATNNDLQNLIETQGLQTNSLTILGSSVGAYTAPAAAPVVAAAVPAPAPAQAPMQAGQAPAADPPAAAAPSPAAADAAGAAAATGAPAPAQAPTSAQAQPASSNSLIHDGSINGIPVWAYGVMGMLAGLIVLCVLGYFGFRRYQKWKADKKQTEYITKYYNNESVVKPHNPYAPRSETVGYNSRLESSALDRGVGSLTMADHGRLASIGRTHSVKSARSLRSVASTQRGTPLRSASITPGSTRRLQMARPSSHVLNTEAPPPLGRQEVFISETPRLTHLRGTPKAP